MFWAAADLGWAVGHSYGCYAPLLTGTKSVLLEVKKTVVIYDNYINYFVYNYPFVFCFFYNFLVLFYFYLFTKYFVFFYNLGFFVLQLVQSFILITNFNYFIFLGT